MTEKSGKRFSRRGNFKAKPLFECKVFRATIKMSLLVFSEGDGSIMAFKVETWEKVRFCCQLQL
jgi:hypothetical protein